MLIIFHLDFSFISHSLLLLIFGNIYLFDRFQPTLLVLLNIGHIHFGTSIIALLMNMIILLAVVAVREWRSVQLNYFYMKLYGWCKVKRM